MPKDIQLACHIQGEHLQYWDPPQKSVSEFLLVVGLCRVCFDQYRGWEVRVRYTIRLYRFLFRVNSILVLFLPSPGKLEQDFLVYIFSTQPRWAGVMCLVITFVFFSPPSQAEPVWWFLFFSFSYFCKCVYLFCFPQQSWAEYIVYNSHTWIPEITSEGKHYFVKLYRLALNLKFWNYILWNFIDWHSIWCFETMLCKDFIKFIHDNLCQVRPALTSFYHIFQTVLDISFGMEVAHKGAYEILWY